MYKPGLPRIILFLFGFASMLVGLSLDAMGFGSPGIGLGQWGLICIGAVFLAFSFTRKVWTERIFLVLVGVFFSLIIAEVGIRVFMPGYLSEVFVLDDELIFRFRANSQSLRNFEGRRVNMKVNSLGMRAAAVSEEGFDKRIAVYGDSIIAAVRTPLEETFPAKLEELLNESSRQRYSVLNTSVVGYGTDQMFLKMKQDIPLIKPDLVILPIYANDFGDNLRNGLFKLQDSIIVPVPVEISSHFRRRFFRNQWSPRVIKFALEVAIQLGTKERGVIALDPNASGAQGLGVLEEVLEFHESIYKQRVERNNYIFEELHFENDHVDFDISSFPEKESTKYKIELTKSILAEVKRFLDSHNIALLVMIIPARIDVCADCFAPLEEKTEYANYSASRISDISEMIARELNIAHLNLFPIFSAGDRKDHNIFYFSNDTHMNSEGQKKAAEEMRNFLMSNPILGNN